MATLSSILAWEIPSEKSGGLQSWGPKKVEHNWVTRQQQRHTNNITDQSNADRWGITFHQPGRPPSKKSTNSKCWREGNCSASCWECKLIQPLWRTVWMFLKTLKTSIWPRNPPTGHIPWENDNSKGHIYPNVHSNTIYSIQDSEATWMSKNRWMDKEKEVHIYNGILLSHKTEWNWVICKDVDEQPPWRFIKKLKVWLSWWSGG